MSRTRHFVDDMLQGLSIAIGGASSDVNLYGGFLGAKISDVGEKILGRRVLLGFTAKFDECFV
jgi:hypothetical protein